MQPTRKPIVLAYITAGTLLMLLLICAGCGGGATVNDYPRLERSAMGKPPPPPPPPANPEIAYVATESTGSWMMVMNADGTNQKKVYNTSNLGGLFGSLTWSPSGAQLAFTIQSTDSVYTINVNGSGLFEVVRPGDSVAGGIAWSPAAVPGRDFRIAYCYAPDHYWDIWLVSPGGGAAENITNVPDGFVVYPTWSPDARRLAYQSSTQNADGTWHHSLLVYDFIDNTTWHVPLGGPFANGDPQLSSLDWARTQDAIAFTAEFYQMVAGQKVYYYELWVVNLGNPSNPVQLTNDPSSNYGGPSWSPNDSQLVYSKGSQIWKMDANGENKTLLLAPTGKVKSVSSPEWKR